MGADIAHRDRYSLVELDTEQHLASFEEEVRAGLGSDPKRIPCRFFYDEAGSEIFEEICEQPEYYLTRAETEILRDRSGEIAAAFLEPISLVELGSGSSTKTRLLIEALLDRHGELSYVPLDISPTILEASAEALLADYPRLEVHAVAAEYEEGLRQLRAQTDRPKLVIWLGSTIGNLPRPEATRFVASLSDILGPDDRLLVGIDLRKDRATLERAYDDEAGVTARFNRNLLDRINRELAGGFDAKSFAFRARYDEGSGSVESHLVSLRDQVAVFGEPAVEVHFAAGETIHTESSIKYSPEEIDAVAAAAGLRLCERWLDAAGRFSLNLFARAA